MYERRCYGVFTLDTAFLQDRPYGPHLTSCALGLVPFFDLSSEFFPILKLALGAALGMAEGVGVGAAAKASRTLYIVHCACRPASG